MSLAPTARRSPTLREISLPARARALSTLSRIDYHDAFLVDAGIKRSPERWARSMLLDTPLSVRMRLVAGWTALGLELGGPWSRDHVLGWKVQERSPEHVLLVAGSRLGLEGQLLFGSEPDGVLFATFVHTHNPAVRSLWKRVIPLHRRTVRSLLAHAARRQAMGIS